MRLTEEAEAEYLEFVQSYESYGCSCHLNAPCWVCTHPGNPLNQENDPSCWEAEPTQQDAWDAHKQFIKGL